jgi:zinc protease
MRVLNVFRAAFGVISCLFFSLTLFAQTPPPKKITAIEGITEYRLDNGLRVLLFPDSSKPLVTVNLTVFVGSRHEGYGETGMAHLLEHMLFKGTPTFPNVPKSLQDHGAKLFNGTTWVDRTNYYETMPSSDENLEFAIQLEADRMINSYVKREDLITEMTVVRNEFEAGENDPQAILSQRMAAVAFEWHNYGKSTIGNRSDIERVPIENLQQFYRKHYQPDNAMLVIAGKFDDSKALTFVQKYFGSLKKPQRRLESTYTEEPVQDGERLVTLRRVGSVGVVGALYHIPAGAHPDYPAVEILENALTMESAGRLYKALIESKKANKLMGSAFGWHDPGMLEVMATCEPAKLDDVRDTLIETLENVAKNPITDEEVNRSRLQLLRQREDLNSDSARLAVRLSEWAACGDWRLFFLHRDRLEKVTAADVNRVAQNYLIRANRTVGVFLPTDKPVRVVSAATPDIAKLVENYQGRTAIKAGEAFDPTPANLDARLQRSKIGTIKVGLLPKQTRGEKVTLQFVLRFGSVESLKGQRAVVDFMADLLDRGTDTKSRQQIKDQFDKLKSSFKANAEPGELTITLQTERAHLAAAMDLLIDVLRHPAFPASELDILKREVIDGIKKGDTDPIQKTVREMRRRLAPYEKDHPLYIPTAADELAQTEAVTREQIAKLYSAMIPSPVGEIAVIGDFDSAVALQKLGELFKDWNGSVKYERIERPAFTKVPGARETINTPDKANAFYLAALSAAVGDTDADYPALEIGNYIFGGGALSSRLGTRVRQKEGLSYAVNSHFQSSARDKSAAFMMYAICNPKNMEKVDKAIAEEMSKYLENGPSLAEMADAQKAWTEGRKVGRTNDAQLSMEIVNHLNLDRSFQFDADIEKKVGEVGPSDVKDAFRKHLDPKRLIIIQAGDFNKKN